ncbi:hypothetical protein F2Q69_00021327 [Brassica cretica]|uniref:Uncharacterized protein n=1 Tax=Brassica cretica TaxID=69181 RepID=A0A8S9QEG2_BRACR|nr:hypothetical protein F2Q69_00021327 [Brassica cretica]
MSDSGEAKESHPAVEQDFKSQEGQTTQNSNKRTLDEASKNETSELLMAVLGFMMQHHEKNTNCFVCNQPTLGVFNTAVDIKKKIVNVRQKARAMVKEVSTMLAKALVIRKDADAMAAQSAGMVEDVETVMGIVDAHGETSAEDPTSWDEIVDLVESMEVVAAKAKEMAEKAAEMVKEANDTTETAKREMAKALGVMRKVKWNV